jgi:hypothetical protein
VISQKFFQLSKEEFEKFAAEKDAPYNEPRGTTYGPDGIHTPIPSTINYFNLQ